MKKIPDLRLSALFILLVFGIQFVSSSIFPFITIIAFHLGYLQNPNPVVMLVFILCTSVVIGLVLSKIISKRVLKPITDLNEATKKVAKGEFDVHIEEIGIGREIIEMTHSFNIMTQELKNIETFRSDFISNVSHEFKTPLSAIEGYATLLQDETLSKPEREQYITRILASSKRLSTLSGNILMISKLENQQIVLDKKWFSLDEQIRNCILSLERLWSEKSISMDVDLDNVSYYGNKSMMSHIWFNLLSNAIRFTPKGVISVQLKKEKGKIVLRCADTGVGMSKKKKKHIFEKFFCGDRSRNDGGNGLGLTLVKRIVELCDGTIEVESQEEIGSTFWITLPEVSHESMKENPLLLFDSKRTEGFFVGKIFLFFLRQRQLLLLAMPSIVYRSDPCFPVPYDGSNDWDMVR